MVALWFGVMVVGAPVQVMLAPRLLAVMRTLMPLPFAPPLVVPFTTTLLPRFAPPFLPRFAPPLDTLFLDALFLVVLFLVVLFLVVLFLLALFLDALCFFAPTLLRAPDAFRARALLAPARPFLVAITLLKDGEAPAGGW